MFDAVVIGGGPSGAHFAVQAAKKGYKVAIVEKGVLGRSKCCAGGLSARFLAEYKVPAKLVEREIRSFVMVSPTGEKTELTFNKTSGVTVNRAPFDRWLLEEALDCGCTGYVGANAERIKIQKSQVEVELSGSSVCAKVAIGAFGMSPLLLRQIGLETPEFTLGLQTEISAPQTEIDTIAGDALEFHFNPKYSQAGYTWIFPKKEKVALGVATAPPQKQKVAPLQSFVSDYVTAHPGLKQYLPDKLNIGCAMLPNYPLKKTFGDRFMLLGDAAGLIEPTTWEGIYFAFKSADLALGVFGEKFDEEDFSEEALGMYQQQWRALFGKELDHARSIQQRVYGARMGKLWTLIIHELNHDQALKQLVTDELSRDMSIANMVDKVPLKTKLRLIAKYTR